MENLFKILEALWAESIFVFPGAGTTSETAKLEKKIANLLDLSNTEDYIKDLEVNSCLKSLKIDN